MRAHLGYFPMRALSATTSWFFYDTQGQFFDSGKSQQGRIQAFK